MNRASRRSPVTGHGPSARSVSIVVESDDWSRQFSGRASSPRRNPSGERFTAWTVITLVFASGGLALFDLYLLLSSLQ